MGQLCVAGVRGEFKLCMDLAAEAIQFVGALNDPGMMMEALFLSGLTMVYRGDFAGANDHCSLAVADFDDRKRTKFWATHTGQDSGAAHRCYLALALWHLGYPDRAAQLSQETIALARTIGHPFSLEYALHHASWLRQHCQLGDEVQAAADEQIEIATEQGFAFWHATGTLYQPAGCCCKETLGEGFPCSSQALSPIGRPALNLHFLITSVFLATATPGRAGSRMRTAPWARGWTSRIRTRTDSRKPSCTASWASCT